MIYLPSFETEWRLSPLHPVGSQMGLGCQLGYLNVFLKALLKITAPGGVFVATAQVLGRPGTQRSLQPPFWSWGQDLTCSGTWPEGSRKRAVLYGPNGGLFCPSRPPQCQWHLLELGLWQVESLLSETFLLSSFAVVLRPHTAGPWRPPPSISLLWWALMTHPCRGFPICVLRERCSTHWLKQPVCKGPGYSGSDQQICVQRLRVRLWRQQLTTSASQCSPRQQKAICSPQTCFSEMSTRAFLNSSASVEKWIRQLLGIWDVRSSMPFN